VKTRKTKKLQYTNLGPGYTVKHHSRFSFTVLHDPSASLFPRRLHPDNLCLCERTKAGLKTQWCGKTDTYDSTRARKRLWTIKIEYGEINILRASSKSLTFRYMKTEFVADKGSQEIEELCFDKYFSFVDSRNTKNSFRYYMLQNKFFPVLDSDTYVSSNESDVSQYYTLPADIPYFNISNLLEMLVLQSTSLKTVIGLSRLETGVCSFCGCHVVKSLPTDMIWSPTYSRGCNFYQTT